MYMYIHVHGSFEYTFVQTTGEVHSTTLTVLHGKTVIVFNVSHYVELCNGNNLVGTVQHFFERYRM